MKNPHAFNSFRCVLRSARPAITLALLLSASNLTPLFAANPRYIYQGKDNGNNITVNLTIEAGSLNPASVTGSESDNSSSCATSVTGGTLAGNAINADVNESNFTSPFLMIGTLTGTLGSSSSFLTVTNFMFCGVVPVMVDATLKLVLSQVTTPVTQQPGSGVTKFTLPASETMTGGYSLGTTWSASLTLTTTLQGSSYKVLGVITVDQYIQCPILVVSAVPCTSHSDYTALAFSGVLTPGVQGQLSINNAPPGSNPVFYATISSSGTSFTSLVEGIPSVGITHLYLNANP